MIIDVHAHIFPDELALKTVPAMAKNAGIVEALDGRLCSLEESMKTAGINVSWIQPVATKAKQVDSINRWMESIRSESIVSFGAIHPEYEDLPGLIRNLSRAGFPGVKIHPEYHLLEPTDPHLFPLYETLIEENMIVLFHAGYDIEFPTLRSDPKMFIQLAERFPDLTMILAHMGGFRQWDEVREHLCGLDVYLDTSYVFTELPNNDFVEIVRSHGVDKILYGTDTPWADQKEQLERIQSLPFTQEEVDKICGLNAEALLAKVSS